MGMLSMLNCSMVYLIRLLVYAWRPANRLMGVPGESCNT